MTFHEPFAILLHPTRWDSWFALGHALGYFLYGELHLVGTNYTANGSRSVILSMTIVFSGDPGPGSGPARQIRYEVCKGHSRAMMKPTASFSGLAYSFTDFGIAATVTDLVT